MDFRITGLDPTPFRPLYGLAVNELAARGVIRMVADDDGYPDRVEMRHVPIGATVLLLNHTCQLASTPYRATHAIFVREGALET